MGAAELWNVAPQAGVAVVLLAGVVYVLRANREDRRQQQERIDAIQSRHDAELAARDQRIERQEQVISELRTENEAERKRRREAEEREHALRMGGQA